MTRSAAPRALSGPSRPTRTAARLVAFGVALGLLAACSHGAGPTAVPPSATPPPPAVPSVTATPTPAPTTSPLSGRKGGVDTPVVVVKLDNTPQAQPHRGLVDADMVYVEPVEWGLTRLAAVYSTDLPSVTGPVRSARISDITLFAPFGDISFVYSGAQRRLQPPLAAADWTEVSHDGGGSGFHREYRTGRVAPWNLMAEPRHIAKSSGATGTAPDLGLSFSEERPTGGERGPHGDRPMGRVQGAVPVEQVQRRL